MIYFITAVVAFLLGIEYNEWRWRVEARKQAKRWEAAWEQYKKDNPNWFEEMRNDNGGQ